MREVVPTETCINTNSGKYFCQHQHRTGKCANQTTAELCRASCACPDVGSAGYHHLHAAYAPSNCIARLTRSVHQHRVSKGTLVVVNSQLVYRQNAGHLLDTLRGIPFPTAVVYGGCSTPSIRVAASGILTVRVVHDSVDFTGLIGLLENQAWLRQWDVTFDRLFYMHDTMLVYDQTAFVRALRWHDRCRTCSLRMGQSMNIGMYAWADLQRDEAHLQLYRGPVNATVAQRVHQKQKGRKGWEGALFHRYGAWAQFDICGCELSTARATHEDRGASYYGEPRVRVNFSEWGLLKFAHRHYSGNSSML